MREENHADQEARFAGKRAGLYAPSTKPPDRRTRYGKCWWRGYLEARRGCEGGEEAPYAST